MRNTTAIEKLIPSVLNVSLILVLTAPVGLWYEWGLEWKFTAILAMYTLQIIDTHDQSSFQCFGMRVIGTVWKGSYSRWQKNLYSILYTLSFSTVFFSIWFPFDLLLLNLLCVQLLCVRLTGTTFHGYLAGNMVTRTAESDVRVV